MSSKIIKSNAKRELYMSVMASLFKGNLVMMVIIFGCATFQVIMVISGTFEMLTEHFEDIAKIADLKVSSIARVTLVASIIVSYFLELVVFTLVFNGKKSQSVLFASVLALLAFAVKYPTIPFSQDWTVWTPKLLFAALGSLLPVFIAHTLGDILAERSTDKETILGQVTDALQKETQSLLVEPEPEII